MTVTSQFEISTADGVAFLTGELMRPEDRTLSRGTLLIVPGGWFADRDGDMGDSGTEADLMYLRIARRVCAEGFIVARYDNRGVTGNACRRGLVPDEIDTADGAAEYLRNCVDPQVRKSVTPETLMSDVVTVCEHLSAQSAVAADRVAIFAHSEGGLHVARALERLSIPPRGVVLAGTSMLSPAGCMRWQMVDRCVEEVMSWDEDNAGRVTEAEVERRLHSSFLLELGIHQSDLAMTGAGWTESDTRSFFEGRYQAERDRALAAADEATFPTSDDESFVAASYRWYKQWFRDEVPTLEFFARFRGKLAIHYGEIDRQLALAQEIRLIESHTEKWPRVPHVVVHPRCGHALGRDRPLSGPMDSQAEDRLVADILEMLR